MGCFNCYFKDFEKFHFNFSLLIILFWWVLDKIDKIALMNLQLNMDIPSQIQWIKQKTETNYHTHSTYSLSSAITLFLTLISLCLFTYHYLPFRHQTFKLTFLLKFLMNVFDQHFKALVYVRCCLCADLNERNTKSSCQCQAFFYRYVSLFRKIAFCGH